MSSNPILVAEVEVPTAPTPEPEVEVSVATLVAALATATGQVREMAGHVSDAATDCAVRTDDLAALITAVNALGRACAGVESVAVAGFARRDEVADPVDPFAAARPQQVRARGFVHEDAGLEMAHLLAVSETSGSTKVDRAAELTNRMPLTLAAVTEGRIEIWQAHQLLDECRLLDDDEARQVDEWLYGRLGRIEPTRLRAAARYAVGRVNPDRVRRRAQKARVGRTLELCPSSEPGLAQLYALVPSHHAAAIWEAASALARDYRELDPTLTMDQARADAFVDLLLADVDVRASVTLGIPVVTGAASAVGEAHEPRPDPTQGKAPEDLTPEDLDFLFGPEQPDDPPRCEEPRAPTRSARTDDSARADGPEQRAPEPGGCAPDPRYEGPGTAPDRIPDWMLDPRHGVDPEAPIHGTGPLAGAFTSGVTIPRVGHIPADVIALLLERLDLTVSRALIDAADGTVLETVTDAYSPPRRMRDFVVVRDGQCRMYGCARPAAGCDLDHATPFDAGGATTPQNLAGLCRHHHRAKQSRAWIYELDPRTGTATWVNTRTGTVRTTEPLTSVAAFAMHLRATAQPVTLPPPVASSTTSGPADPGPPPF